MSPGTAQTIRSATRELKSLQDISAYSFQALDENQQATIQNTFVAHRIVEVQKAFERLMLARTAQEQQVAFEALVYLFQLANDTETES